MYQIEAFMRVSARYKTSVERKLKQDTTTVTEIVALLQIGFEDVHKKGLGLVFTNPCEEEYERAGF